MSSKALRRRSSLVLARTLLGSCAGRGLARAQSARVARVEFFPNPPPGCQSGDERSLQVRAGAEAAAAKLPCPVLIIVLEILRAGFHILDNHVFDVKIASYYSFSFLRVAVRNCDQGNDDYICSQCCPLGHFSCC